MTPIKFRAWDLTNKKWLDLKDYAINPDNGRLLLADDTGFYYFDGCEYRIVQFTGLLDKNGKEIYEGDIVTVSYRNVFLGTFPMCWEGNGYWLDYGDEMFEMPCVSSREVIGNIYENPELLTPKP